MSYVKCPGHPCTAEIVRLNKSVQAALVRIAELVKDRDAWKQAHEDLLAVRQQDVAALVAKARS